MKPNYSKLDTWVLKWKPTGAQRCSSTSQSEAHDSVTRSLAAWTLAGRPQNTQQISPGRSPDDPRTLATRSQDARHTAPGRSPHGPRTLATRPQDAHETAPRRSPDGPRTTPRALTRELIELAENPQNGLLFIEPQKPAFWQTQISQCLTP